MSEEREARIRRLQAAASSAALEGLGEDEIHLLVEQAVREALASRSRVATASQEADLIMQRWNARHGARHAA